MTDQPNILVAIDFSRGSSDALHQGARIAASTGAALRVLHVVRPPARLPFMDAIKGYSPPSESDLIREAERRWGEFAPDCKGKAEAEFTVVVDTPRDAILKAVEAFKPLCLVMGATSTRDRDRGIGTVAAACLQRADCPVLLVREGQAHPFSSVGVGIDFTPTARRALESAVRVASQDGAVLHLIHMYDDPWYSADRPDDIEADLPDFYEKMREAYERQLREFAEPLADEMASIDTRYHAIAHHEHWSGQGEGLTAFIVEHGLDLMVLGVRSKFNARDFLWGSTAQRICRDASCSILTVRPVPDKPSDA